MSDIVILDDSNNDQKKDTQKKDIPLMDKINSYLWSIN